MAQDDVKWLAFFVINSVETPLFAVALYNINSSNNKHNERTYFVKQSPFDKKTVAQLIIRISVLYGAQNFISLLTSLRHLVLSWVTSAAQLDAVFKISINATPVCTGGSYKCTLPFRFSTKIFVDNRFFELRWIFRKRDVGARTGSSWFRIGTGGEHL
jgi:hypothetical protein